MLLTSGNDSIDFVFYEIIALCTIYMSFDVDHYILLLFSVSSGVCVCVSIIHGGTWQVPNE